MFLRELTMPPGKLRGVGPAASEMLLRLGMGTVADLLSWWPRDWEDRSNAVPLAEFGNHPAVNTVVRVIAHDWFGFGRMKTLKVYVEDESARAVLVCFNRPFLEKQLVAGKRYRLWGKFFWKYGEIQSGAFETDPLPEGETLPARELLPVYRLSQGLAQGKFRKIMRSALDSFAPDIEDEIPRWMRERDSFLPKTLAVRALHFPGSGEELAAARRSLIYEELFHLELMVGKRALERRGNAAGSVRVSGNADMSPLQKRLLERLPFELTPGQKKAVLEINRDMESPWPMARLLQGDVGSGKTLVSFLAALRALENGAPGLPGGQTAILAPTELLARQHAENAAALLEPLGVRIAFLTGNLGSRSRGSLLAALAAGEIDLVAGTHALFSRDVCYRNLRLAVVDEQHRFGVTQRQAILDKGKNPHLLMMSATPIPRTLAFTVFGDLDVSVIPDLPPGRKPVKTHLASEESEGRVYDFVRKELAAGRQAYFVYPLIGEDDSDAAIYDEGSADPSGDGAAPASGGLKAAVYMAERLAEKVFPGFSVALVHSRLDGEEKRRRMESFRRGDTRVLVATSVVEVGVDVPNATCMVIEHAERFGLAALHQLRGRVGRGPEQSYCFLVWSAEAADGGLSGRAERYGTAGPPGSAGLGDDAKTRLRVMLESTDGFVIAEEDLKLRGPGQIAGTEQSGYLRLGIADPVRDAEELARARDDAFGILEKDPGLLKPENAVIRELFSRAPPFSGVSL